MAQGFDITAASVLLIDDSEDDFEFAERALQSAPGPKVSLTWCKTGAQALELLEGVAEDGLPQLILLDLNLPDLNGRALLKRLKESETLKAIPAVVMSNSIAERDVASCYMLGANSYIQKPLDFTEFRELMGVVKTYWLDVAALPARA